MNKSRLRFTKVRLVKTPVREYNSAGYDFFIPTNLTPTDLEKCNSNSLASFQGLNPNVHFSYDSKGFMTNFVLNSHGRAIIPSGIRMLIEPTNSMLQVNNKSGVATKTGVLYTANIIDSDYTGEIHLAVVNSGENPILFDAGQKLVQLIHIPIYTPALEELPNEYFDEIARNWGDRGSNGFGSSDTTLEDELNLRQ